MRGGGIGVRFHPGLCLVGRDLVIHWGRSFCIVMEGFWGRGSMATSQVLVR